MELEMEGSFKKGDQLHSLIRTEEFPGMTDFQY